MEKASGSPFEIEVFIRGELAKVLNEPLSTKAAKIHELSLAQKVYNKTELRKIVNELESERQKSIDSNRTITKKVVQRSDAFLPEGVMIPRGYEVNADGLHAIVKEKDEEKLVLITKSLIFVSATTENIDEGVRGVEIQYNIGRRKCTITEPQETIASRHKIVSLSNKGVEVTSANADHLVRYLRAQQNVSADLPHRIVTSRSGWNEYEGRTFFTFGKAVVGDPRVVKQSLGNENFYQSLAEGGNADEWTQGMNWFCQHSVPLFVIGAAMAAPLLKLLNVSNFLIHLFGNSSIGKTTTHRAALSFYGCPRDGKLMNTWQATDTGLEARLALFSGLPTPLDDSSQARDEKFIQRVPYLIGNGQGRSRGTPSGAGRDVAVFSTVAISTGEGPLSSHNSLRGQEVRTIELGCEPFHPGDPELASNIALATKRITDNFGFGARPYLNFLVNAANCKDDLTSLRTWHEAEKEKISRLEASQYLARTASYFAAISVALQIAAEVIPTLNITKAMIDEAISVAHTEHKTPLQADQNIDVKALTYVWETIFAEPHKFLANDRNMQGEIVENLIPRGTIQYLGRRVVSNRNGEKKVGYAIYRKCLIELLKKGDFNPPACMRYFKEKKWVWLDSKGELWPINPGQGEPTIRAFVFDQNKAVEAGILHRDDDSAQEVELDDA